MNELIIHNARIVTPDKLIENGSLHIFESKIKNITASTYQENTNGINVINAEGALLIPGIIDIHTDAMDMEICPRGSADFPIPVAFAELEKRMCSCGITTVYHSLHLGYKEAEKFKKSKYSRTEVFEEVYKLCKKKNLINHKIHLRFEITGVEDYDLCFYFMDQNMIDLFSFMDHTPGQGQMSKDLFIEYATRKKGLTVEQATNELERLISSPRIEGERLEKLVSYVIDKGIAIASHDDDTVEKVKSNKDLGINICEFPINVETARCATQLGMSVVGGASNVLRGGSTGNNLHVQSAIENKIVDTLCSDYYPPAMLYSIFKLYNEGSTSLNEAVNMVSLNPAKAVGIADKTGSIETGKDADILLVDVSDSLPKIQKVLVKGKWVSLYNDETSKKAVFENANIY